ncbi:Uma2 family endonuclease [Embleya sp. AB8]|uniref:Uma2 family endonuclease n=1 Tax=Embleya sp. AB8 TaxID=3156304 RepID=UPI003C70FC82
MPAPPWWTSPPNGTHWTAADLDDLPADAPEHVELVDGALNFRSAPQTRFDSRVRRNLTTALAARAPAGVAVDARMSVRLDELTCLEPDLVAYRATDDFGRTWFDASEVRLVVEMVPARSERRKLEPARYAEAGIPHFWRVEEEAKFPVVYVFELEPSTRTYVPTGIHRTRLEVAVPFPIEIDLAALLH